MQTITWHLHLALELVCTTVIALLLLVKAFVSLLLPAKLKELRGQVVVVTGAAQGLGRELALEFSAHGATVACVDLNTAGVEDTAGQVNRAGRAGAELARAYTCDVSNRGAVLNLAASVQKDLGHVDILVNNAGIVLFNDLLGSSETEIKAVIDVNLMSQFWMAQAFLPAMMERESGQIVAISSLSGIIGLANAIPYSTSKFGVTGFMSALSEELRLQRNNNIKITCVNPYFIFTKPVLEKECDLRLPAMRATEVASMIVHGVRQDLEFFTVPRPLYVLTAFLKLFPKQVIDLYRDVFYAKIKNPAKKLDARTQILRKKRESSSITSRN